MLSSWDEKDSGKGEFRKEKRMSYKQDLEGVVAQKRR